MLTSGEHQLWDAHMTAAPVRARYNAVAHEVTRAFAAMRPVFRQLGITMTEFAERLRATDVAMRSAAIPAAEAQRRLRAAAAGIVPPACPRQSRRNPSDDAPDAHG